MIELGDKVKDKVSGITGVVTERREYINGCVQYIVQPKATKKDPDKMPDAYVVDEGQLDVVKSKCKIIKKRRTGGPTLRITHGV